MEPYYLEETLPSEALPKVSRLKTLRWMCLPYFCVEKYARPAALRVSSHPMKTLLQARFSLVRKERDMQQAVSRLTNVPADHCFHIAQVWCLLLGDCDY